MTGTPFKLLRIIPDLQVGGVQRQLFRSLTHLRELGVEGEVCCIGERGPLAGEFEQAGFPVHVFRFRSRLDVRGLMAIRRLVRARGIDLVHSHMYAANIAANFATIGLGGVAVLNGYHSITPVSGKGQRRRLRWTRNWPEGYLAVSGAVRDALLELGAPAEHIHVVYNGIELPPAGPAPPEADPARPLRLIWAGRYVKQKQLGFFVELMDEARRRELPARLRLLGEGPQFENIGRAIDERDLRAWIETPGVSHDVAGELAGADLVVSSSGREGFPNMLLEAAAAGRGMVLSDIAPHREFIGASGCGVIPGDDPAQWCETLATLAQDRARVRAMGAAAWERAREFGMRAVTEELLKVYETIRG